MLHPSTHDWWGDALQEAQDPGTGEYGSDDGEDRSYAAEAESLERFLSDEASPWLVKHRLALENRPLIRAQAFGEALDPDRLDKLARYEAHLDRKLDRVLGMLLKLQDLRHTITPKCRRLNPFRKIALPRRSGSRRPNRAAPLLDPMFAL